MNRILKFILIVAFLNLCGKVFAHVPEEQCKYGYIFTLYPFFSSNLVEESYLSYVATSDEPVNFDSIIFALSKKCYTSESGIRDSLSRQFKIYRIVQENSKNKKDYIRRIDNKIADRNNYHTGYIYRLNDVSYGYIIFIYKHY